MVEQYAFATPTSEAPQRRACRFANGLKRRGRSRPPAKTPIVTPALCRGLPRNSGSHDLLRGGCRDKPGMTHGVGLVDRYMSDPGSSAAHLYLLCQERSVAVLPILR